MRPQTRWYVFVVAACAAIWGSALYFFAPVVTASMWVDAALFALLATSGEALSVLLPQSATGTMGFIAYVALALVVPAWPSVAAVAVVKLIVEVSVRRAPIKIVFNVASHSIMEAAAITLFLVLGGKSLVSLPDVSHLATITREVGAAALIACVVAVNANNLLVAGAIASSTRRHVFRVWIENSRGSVGADLLATPLIFIFAWVYAAFGVIASATLWIPMLGLRQLQRTNLELEQTNRELLELMVKSLEARDPYTSGHSRRVHHYSMVIARAIGLSERQAEEVGRAALLHDVGKIHEKYAAVLAKQDKLTPEEWAVIQEHPEDGATLVATMTRLRDVVPAIRHHHENWDGTGYPHGLAGELIPLASRIIRFSDTIDAMTTERPYRRPLTEAQVRAEVVRCRGTQFDPTITDRLLSSALWASLFSSPAIVVDPPQRARISVVGGQRRTEVGEGVRSASVS